MTVLPNLAGTATKDLVENIGSGSFNASYINWSRTMNLLRTHAPGWLPVLVPNVEGGILHRAPVGCYLLIKFRHMDGSETPPMPQAIMDSHNKAIALERVTARDITDTHRRGICMAAAMTFGLAYELWAKMPLESGYAEPEPAKEEAPAVPEKVSGPPTLKALPTDGVWDKVTDEQCEHLEQIALTVSEYMEGEDAAGAMEYIGRHPLSYELKTALWTLLPSKTRTALKKVTPKEQAA